MCYSIGSWCCRVERPPDRFIAVRFLLLFPTFPIVASKPPRCPADADPLDLNPPQASAALGSELALSVRSGSEWRELARGLGLGAADPGGHLQFPWAPRPLVGPARSSQASETRVLQLEWCRAEAQACGSSLVFLLAP